MQDTFEQDGKAMIYYSEGFVHFLHLLNGTV